MVTIAWTLMHATRIFDTIDVLTTRAVILYRNAPCVVFGAHQNPWRQCNVGVARDRGIQLFRRQSGGGTVFHDEGNLNYCFVTHRSLFSKSMGSGIVADALKKGLGIEASLNARADVILDSRKVRYILGYFCTFRVIFVYILCYFTHILAVFMHIWAIFAFIASQLVYCVPSYKDFCCLCVTFVLTLTIDKRVCFSYYQGPLLPARHASSLCRSLQSPRCSPPRSGSFPLHTWHR